MPTKRHSSLYRRLAWTNLLKNSQIYLPFGLMNIFLVAMYFIIRTISVDSGIKAMNGGDTLGVLMGFGVGVMVVFSAVLVFYTNGFLMKRRKREIGVYNILGFSKRHIARMMTLETLIVAALCIPLGLVAGTILMKLLYMLLLRLTQYPITLSMPFSLVATIETTLLFLSYFVVVTIYNLLHITLAKPIELVRGSSVGEREPKTRWLLTLTGTLALGGGYYFASTVVDPISAISIFFIAVIAVIYGTYALFTTGSIVLLKALRRNHRFYYKTKHFAVVSGMLYRMKQHAAGLATLCILSTMVMVSISTTISLYAGLEDSLAAMYPKELGLLEFAAPPEVLDELKARLESTAKAEGIILKNLTATKSLSLMTNWSASDQKVTSNEKFSQTDSVFLNLFNQEDALELFGRIQADGSPIPYSTQGIAVLVSDQKLADKLFPQGPVAMRFGELTVPVSTIALLPKSIVGGSAQMLKTAIVVFPEDGLMTAVYDGMKSDKIADNMSGFDLEVSVDVLGTPEQKLALANRLRAEDDLNGRVKSRSLMRREFTDVYGGLLFLGIFLGTLFLAATVIIMYYKQITEGYEDKSRYETMQKVGMHHGEIKQAIGTQTILVFFLPLVAASIHILFAFNIMKVMLSLFGFSNLMVFAMCTVGTGVAFALVYLAFYKLTARSYFKIVQWQA